MKNEEKKTKVFNVVILDKSGSMSSIAREAVDSVNETLGSIRSAQEKNENQTHTITLVAFCGCEQRRLFFDTPIAEAQNLSYDDYNPCCMTPLYDAIGNTITAIHDLWKKEEKALVSVTIITDGYENASREFSGKAIKALIDAYKKEGWLFAYIGADHDVAAVSADLSISSCMQFSKSSEGVQRMSLKSDFARDRWLQVSSAIMDSDEMELCEKNDKIGGLEQGLF